MILWLISAISLFISRNEFFSKCCKKSKRTTSASIGAGDVAIVLCGVDEVMRPSWKAAKTLSTKYNGLSSAIERVLRLDMSVVVDVVAIGLGYTSTKRPPEDLERKIYETGLTDDTGGLAERCVTFLHVLAGGGRLPDSSGGGDDDSADPFQS